MPVMTKNDGSYTEIYGLGILTITNETFTGVSVAKLNSQKTLILSDPFKCNFVKQIIYFFLETNKTPISTKMPSFKP